MISSLSCANNRHGIQAGTRERGEAFIGLKGKEEQSTEKTRKKERKNEKKRKHSLLTG